MKADPFVQDFLDKLDKVKVSGHGWAAKCPSHEDSMPSLSVSVGEGGRILVNCHKGCSVHDITGALNMKPADLFPDDGKPRKELIATYEYVDEDGDLVFQVQRFQERGRKTFTQRRPDGIGGWIYTTTGIDKPLYRLPEVLEAVKDGSWVWIVEGEKDVETLRAQGMVATCNPGGAGKWEPAYGKWLKDARVRIIADDDDVGWEHARRVATGLADVASEIVVLRPKEGKDLTDHVEAGHSLTDLEPLPVDADAELLVRVRQALAKNLEPRVVAERIRGLAQKRREAPQGGRMVRWDEFLAEPVPEYDWVVPRLLERSERIIVVAPEGAGKTMLARQVALMTAAGIQPFSLEKIPPIRTLFFDLENPERIVRRTSHRIRDSLQMHGLSVGDRASLVLKPDGVNLLKEEDQALIEGYIAEVEPDLVFLGPLYKAFIDPGGRTSEAVTTEVAMFLDHLRDAWGCALWLEHHAPLGQDGSRDLRPFGSSVWSRWPEFGIGLKPTVEDKGVYELKHFRGARDDQRDWPKAIARGGEWPFMKTSIAPVSYDN